MDGAPRPVSHNVWPPRKEVGGWSVSCGSQCQGTCCQVIKQARQPDRMGVEVPKGAHPDTRRFYTTTWKVTEVNTPSLSFIMMRGADPTTDRAHAEQLSLYRKVTSLWTFSDYLLLLGSLHVCHVCPMYTRCFSGCLCLWWLAGLPVWFVQGNIWEYFQEFVEKMEFESYV